MEIIGVTNKTGQDEGRKSMAQDVSEDPLPEPNPHIINPAQYGLWCASNAGSAYLQLAGAMSPDAFRAHAAVRTPVSNQPGTLARKAARAGSLTARPVKIPSRWVLRRRRRYHSGP